MDNRPLAEKLRPNSLKEIYGQAHILGNDGLLTKLIKQGRLESIILWGPPGCGKTTIARLLAKQSNAVLKELSAVTASKKDVLSIAHEARSNNRLGIKTILFIDEIHRFNKAQQDAFLPYVEDGSIILVGATTENPSFEIINPLLSRSKVIVLEPLSKLDMIKILKRASKFLNISDKRLPKDSLNYLIELANGDARIALNNLELTNNLSNKKIISKETIEQAFQRKMPTYDKNGEYHYNLISAFIKSMRGSAVDAALYYLARMLAANEDPKFIARRMIIFASEDIGMAAPAALNIAVSTFLAVERIGLPEAEYNLYHCAVVMSKAPKSRSVADAMFSAKQTAKQFPDLAVPLHLRNSPTKLMSDLGYGKDAKWESGFKHPKGFMPPEIDKLYFFKD